VNTVVLLISSGCLEMARKRVNDIVQLRRWWLAATVLGAAFLIGQGIVWRQLWDAGVFLGTNPSSSFFYLLTATHGIHLLGGVIALLVLTLKLWKGLLARMHVDVMALYWHSMDGLWVFLLLLFVIGR
jgi:cytochrome c oxidase subunit 3